MSTPHGTGGGGPANRPNRGWMHSRRRNGAKRPKRKPFLPDFLLLDKRMMLSTFTVTDTSDSASDTGSLRYALTQSNSNGPGPNTIDFDIPTSDSGYSASTGVWTISALSALPSITVPVDIDGTSQPGYTNAPQIDIDGAGAGAGADGLVLGTGSDGSVVSALAINAFSAGAGVLVETTDNTIEASYIGTDATGTLAVANLNGIELDTGSSGNTIGGMTTAARNIISGNILTGVFIEASDNLVEGNFIGTDVTGTVALGNNILANDGVDSFNSGGVLLDPGAAGNTIGGLTAIPGTGAGNVISGNGVSGVFLHDTGTGNLIAGNLIGTSAGGATALGNTVPAGNNLFTAAGIVVYFSPGTTIGEPGGTNVISGNGFGVADGYNVYATASSGSVIQSNFIGTDITGTTTLSTRTSVGVELQDGSYTVGGLTTTPGTGPGNVISGSRSFGIVYNVYTAPDTLLVEGNIIGADKTGENALPNLDGGIVVAEASFVTIGGTAAGAGNLISGNDGPASEGEIELGGNSTNNLVEGNFIGTDISGTTRVSAHPGDTRGIGVVIGGNSNTIGGTTAAARNVIAGFNEYAVYIQGASGNLVEGNFIGTNASGTAAIPATGPGLLIGIDASGNTIGGLTATPGTGAGNLISGNTTGITDSSSGDNVFAGNLIGTQAGGLAALPNTGDGIDITSGATGDTVGGTAAGAGNLISGNTGDGIEITGSLTKGNTVEGNLIGTDLTGTLAVANGRGVEIEEGATSNTVGGATAAARNIISGNMRIGVVLAGGEGNVVAGNFIGVDDGSAALANGHYGVFILEADRPSGSSRTGGTTTSGSGISSGNGGGSNNMVGGSATGSGNVISGNGAGGIYIAGGTLDIVAGNLIGTDATGTMAIGNGATGDGVEIAGGGTDNTIGGTNTGARNVISGDNNYGVQITGVGTTGNAVEGNFIGTDSGGTVALPNYEGVEIDTGASGNTIGGAASAGNLISGNENAGVDIEGGTTANVVAGNQIGTEITGTVTLPTIALPNNWGIYVAGTDNTIGGLAAGEGNLISGNVFGIQFIDASTGNLVEGNLIGTDWTGTLAVPNDIGIFFAETGGDTIGGTAAGTGNVISGNTSYGIWLGRSGSTGNVIEGNLIGTDAGGTVAVPNGIGVLVNFGANNNTIGGMTSGAGNVISGNSVYGVEISDDGSSGNEVAGNEIGIDVVGTISYSIANGTGVEIDSAASGNTIGGTASGAGNVISGNAGDGVEITGDETMSNVVAGNKIGTDVAGTVALPNVNGVTIEGNASGNTVGGTVSGAGNLISGNTGVGVDISDASQTSDNVVAGNLVGTDVSGTVALPNTIGVELGASTFDNTVGGTTSSAANVISGNTSYGLYIESSHDNVVEGNQIGLEISGTVVANYVGVEIDDSLGNTIGGTSAGTANTILGNTEYGVDIESPSSTGNLIAGNQIGNGFVGTIAISNSSTGVNINDAPDNTIGGIVASASNQISGNNDYGIELQNGTTGTVVEGNAIGTNSSGTVALPNVVGIYVFEASDNTIGGTATGAGNTIAFNTGDAVDVDTGTGNPILENLVYANGSGIVLSSGGNDDQTAPVITAVTTEPAVALPAEITISVDLTAAGFTPGSTYSLDFFADSSNDPAGGVQAHYYLGTETLSGGTTGNVTFTSFTTPLFTSQTVTATATLVAGSTFTDTSAFATPATMVTELSDYVVTTTAATGAGSLEQAILNANAATSDTNAYVILFGITTGSAPYVINPQPGGLTPITHSVVLYAESQPGYGGTPIIVLDGTGVTTSGLVLATGSDGSAIRGFDIINFTAAGTAGIEVDSGGNVVQANYVGVQTDGITAGQNTDGVLVEGANNTIGGTTPGTGNVISGNENDGVELSGAGASGNVVAGNLIGTDIAGSVAIANAIGVEIDTGASGNTIGGLTSVPGTGAGNLISGNAGGISDYGGGNDVFEGNLIGLQAGGLAPLPNTGGGIGAAGAGDTIGGTAAGSANVISGNGVSGVFANGGVIVVGNLIGTDSSGSVAVGNALGIDVGKGDNTIGGTIPGARNVISGNTGDGIQIGFYPGFSVNTLIEGNYIGLDSTGTFPLGNGGDGIDIPSPPQAGGNATTIGGTIAGSGNVISANAQSGISIASNNGDNLIERNFIGTDYTGTTSTDLNGDPLGNQGGGISDAGVGDTIGGLTSDSRNVISGNVEWGVGFGTGVSAAGGDLLAGNYIGTDVNGTVALPNTVGVQLGAGGGITIGGTTSGAANVISGNDSGIIDDDTHAGGSVIEGNLIGTEAGGMVALGNSGDGIDVLAVGQTIGGTASGAGNVISGNTDEGIVIGTGQLIEGGVAKDNVVEGNLIGTDLTGTVAIPNNDGVNLIGGDDNGNTIGGTAAGAGNLISGNANDGVLIQGSSGNTVVGNQIGTDKAGRRLWQTDWTESGWRMARLSSSLAMTRPWDPPATRSAGRSQAPATSSRETRATAWRFLVRTRRTTRSKAT